MEFHEIDTKGVIWIQRLATLPSWAAADEGRLVYVEADDTFYYGTSTAWTSSFSFKNIAVAGQSTVVADSNDDTLTLVAGEGITITTTAGTDTVTFTTAFGFKTFAVSGQSSVVADAIGDTMTLVGANGVTITTDAGTDTVTFTGANTFGTVAVSGQSNVVADTTGDTLTFIGGTGITLTTDAGADSITATVNQGAIVHQSISGAGTNTHATIDSHIASTTVHGATGAVVGTTNSQTLTNKTLTTPIIADLTGAQHGHTNAASGGALAHSNMSGVGTNTHNQIDTHIASTSQHGVTGEVVGTQNTQTLTNKTLTTPILTQPVVGDFTSATHDHSSNSKGGAINHSTMIGGGTNTHAQIDSHIAATSAHGTSSAIVGVDDSQTLRYKTLVNPVHTDFTNANHGHADAGGGGTVSHLSLSNIGTNAHTTIDAHIAASTAHDATGGVVGATKSQTLTNKTLVSPVISDMINANHTHASSAQGGTVSHTSLSDIGTNTHATIDVHIASTSSHGTSGGVVGVSNTQTLTNKTLTVPVITDLTNAQHGHTSAATGGAITHFTDTIVHGATGAVVGTTNSQTLTNKTLTTPVVSDFTNANHDHSSVTKGGPIRMIPNSQTFTTSASWTCPSGVYIAYFTGVASGGAGRGGSSDGYTNPGSGGAGGSCLRVPVIVIPGESYLITVGTGRSSRNVSNIYPIDITLPTTFSRSLGNEIQVYLQGGYEGSAGSGGGGGYGGYMYQSGAGGGCLPPEQFGGYSGGTSWYSNTFGGTYGNGGDSVRTQQTGYAGKNGFAKLEW